MTVNVLLNLPNSKLLIECVDYYLKLLSNVPTAMINNVITSLILYNASY